MSRLTLVQSEKIAIDARSRELYEKITNLRSNVAGNSGTSNIEFMETIGTNEKFAKLTGG